MYRDLGDEEPVGRSGSSESGSVPSGTACTQRGSASWTTLTITDETPLAAGTRIRTGTRSPSWGVPDGTYSSEPSWCTVPVGAALSMTADGLP